MDFLCHFRRPLCSGLFLLLLHDSSLGFTTKSIQIREIVLIQKQDTSACITSKRWCPYGYLCLLNDCHSYSIFLDYVILGIRQMIIRKRCYMISSKNYILSMSRNSRWIYDSNNNWNENKPQCNINPFFCFPFILSRLFQF